MAEVPESIIEELDADQLLEEQAKKEAPLRDFMRMAAFPELKTKKDLFPTTFQNLVFGKMEGETIDMIAESLIDDGKVNIREAIGKIEKSAPFRSYADQPGDIGEIYKREFVTFGFQYLKYLARALFAYNKQQDNKDQDAESTIDYHIDVLKRATCDRYQFSERTTEQLMKIGCDPDGEKKLAALLKIFEDEKAKIASLASLPKASPVVDNTHLEAAKAENSPSPVTAPSRQSPVPQADTSPFLPPLPPIGKPRETGTGTTVEDRTEELSKGAHVYRAPPTSAVTTKTDLKPTKPRSVTRRTRVGAFVGIGLGLGAAFSAGALLTRPSHPEGDKGSNTHLVDSSSLSAKATVPAIAASTSAQAQEVLTAATATPTAQQTTPNTQPTAVQTAQQIAPTVKPTAAPAASSAKPKLMGKMPNSPKKEEPKSKKSWGF